MPHYWVYLREALDPTRPLPLPIAEIEARDEFDAMSDACVMCDAKPDDLKLLVGRQSARQDPALFDITPFAKRRGYTDE